MAEDQKSVEMQRKLKEMWAEFKETDEFWKKFQIRSRIDERWLDAWNLEILLAYLARDPRLVRRKPPTMIIGEHEIPVPETRKPAEGTAYWLPSLDSREYRSKECVWNGTFFDIMCLRRGLVHLSPDNAEAHGRALGQFTQDN